MISSGKHFVGLKELTSIVGLVKIGAFCIFFLAAAIGLSCLGTGTPESAELATLQPEPSTDDNRPLPEGILFQGEAITVFGVADDFLSRVKPYPTDSSCTGMSDKIFRTTLPESLVGNTRYFRIRSKHGNGFGPERLWIYLDQATFDRIGESSFKEIDKIASSTLESSVFLLENDGSSYVLFIGQESVSSGLGLSRMIHSVRRLETGDEFLNFYSVSNDPHRVKVSRTGDLHFVQIDFNWEKTDEENGPIWLDVSVQRVTDNEIEVIRKRDLFCPDFNRALEQLSARWIRE